jgi:hypothetical protein
MSRDLYGSVVVVSRNFAYNGAVPRLLVVHPDWSADIEPGLTVEREALDVVAFLQDTFSRAVVSEVARLLLPQA